MPGKNRYQKLLEARNKNTDAFSSGFYSTPINQGVINPFDSYFSENSLPIAEEGTTWEPWKSKTSGYGDLTIDGEDFDINAPGEFTTSKIEKDRRKTNKLHDQYQDWLIDENTGTYDANLNPDDNPLANKKWTLHNTSDETMHYDELNPTKLLTDAQMNEQKNQRISENTVAALNKRHESRPELFQKVTGFNPTTKEITYEGDMLSGDITSRDNPDAEFLSFADDNTYSGGFYDDKEGKITGPVYDPWDKIEAEEKQYTYKSAQMGFESDRPRFSPHSQMDVARPMNTLSKFPHGGSHGYSYETDEQVNIFLKHNSNLKHKMK